MPHFEQTRLGRARALIRRHRPSPAAARRPVTLLRRTRSLCCCRVPPAAAAKTSQATGSRAAPPRFSWSLCGVPAVAGTCISKWLHLPPLFEVAAFAATSIPPAAGTQQRGGGRLRAADMGGAGRLGRGPVPAVPAGRVGGAAHRAARRQPGEPSLALRRERIRCRWSRISPAGRTPPPPQIRSETRFLRFRTAGPG